METKRVEVKACSCPGTPHPQDWVEFPASLTVEMGAEATFALQQTLQNESYRGAAQAVSAVEGILAGVWLRHVVAWSFLEPDGTGAVLPVPITAENVERLLPWNDGGDVAIEFADSLYSEDLTRPLVRRRQLLSQAGHNELSTSPSPSSGPKPPKPSRRSSRIATAGRKSGQ